ncbi:MAG: BrnA antitoxin family protein [Alphaproteobacteria bacterium]
MLGKKKTKIDWAARFPEPTEEEDKKLVTAALSDPDNPPLTDEDFKRMRPARRPGQRGPQKAPTKEPVNLRLDKDVLDYFRAAGEGWQTRINDALKKLVHSE